ALTRVVFWQVVELCPFLLQARDVVIARLDSLEGAVGGDLTGLVTQDEQVSRHAGKLQGVVGLAESASGNQETIQCSRYDTPVGNFDDEVVRVWEQESAFRVFGRCHHVRVKV